ncbi:MAG: MerR family transcriptional regulator [Deltaproteobacteria bacterium]
MFDIRISPDENVYVISVVSRLLDVPVWTLRRLDSAGIVSPKRVGKKSRLYSLNDIRRIQYVQYLMVEKHLNISGVRMVLETESGSAEQGRQP